MPLNMSNVRVGAPGSSLLTFPAEIMTMHGSLGADATGFFPVSDARTRAFLACLDAIGPWDDPRTAELEADESRKQMVAYVVVKHGADVLCYRRTLKGSDARLAGLHSVGIGGHVEVADIPEGASSMASAAYRAAYRELREELDSDAFGPPEFHAQISMQIVGVLVDSSNHVGRCHFGIVVRASPDHIDPALMRPGPDSNIEAVRLMRPHDIPPDTLEGWSELLMPALVSGLF